MKKKESLSRKLTLGIFYLLSSSVATVAVNIVTLGVIARALGVENFGLYSAILALVGLFNFLINFGLNKSLLKFGSTDLKRAEVGFGNALLVKGILIVPTFILVVSVGLLRGYQNEEFLILVFLTLSTLLDSYGNIFGSVRRIKGDFKLVSFFRVVKNIINLGIIYVALSINNSVLSLACATITLSIIVFIAALINTILLLKPRVNLKQLGDFFKSSIIFSLSDFLFNIYGRISIVLLSFFNDLHAVGLLSAAIRFTRVANLFPNQVKFALLPTMYRILEGDKPKKSKKMFEMLFKYMMILGTPAVILIYFFSGSIIHLVFGEKFNSSIPLVQLFSVFIFMRFIGSPFKLFYLGLHKNKDMLYIQAAASIIIVILNLILIPKYSAYGACYATLISETLFLFLLTAYGKKFGIWNFGYIAVTLFKTIVAGYGGFSLMTLFLSSTNLFIQIIFLLLMYVFLLVVMKSFDKNDKEFFLKVLKAR